MALLRDMVEKACNLLEANTFHVLQEDIDCVTDSDYVKDVKEMVDKGIRYIKVYLMNGAVLVFKEDLTRRGKVTGEYYLHEIIG